MKALERDIIGYSEQCLENFLEATLFPSAFFDQAVPVRGLCFAAGPDSLAQAKALAEQRLWLGTITLHLATMTVETWRAAPHLFTRPGAEVANLGIILPELDLVSPEMQESVAASVGAIEGVRWFVTARDHRKLSAKLKLPFLVYLGLSPAGKMRFLVQNGQRLQIDEGSLRLPGKRGPRS
jgi:hypothetical protein